VIHADGRAARRTGNDVAGDDGVAGAGHDRHGHADRGLAHDIARHRDVAQVFPPAEYESGIGRVLDDVASDGGVCFDVDAITVFPFRSVGAPTLEVADDVAFDDREAATLVEIRNRDAD